MYSGLVLLSSTAVGESVIVSIARPPEIKRAVVHRSCCGVAQVSREMGSSTGKTGKRLSVKLKAGGSKLCFN